MREGCYQQSVGKPRPKSWSMAPNPVFYPSVPQEIRTQFVTEQHQGSCLSALLWARAWPQMYLRDAITIVLLYANMEIFNFI